MKLRLAVLLLVSLSVPAFAQSAGGVAGISGVVRDKTGGPVPNGKVVISREAQGTLRTLTTNESGVFTAPALVPGPGHKLSVTAPGFAEYTAEGLDLQVGQNLSLNVGLEVGVTVTRVDVTGAVELVKGLGKSEWIRERSWTQSIAKLTRDASRAKSTIAPPASPPPNA